MIKAGATQALMGIPTSQLQILIRWLKMGRALNIFCLSCLFPHKSRILTGRYHVRGGVYSTCWRERLDLDEVTIADTFRSAGYTTGAFGKWHNGMQYPYHPNGKVLMNFMVSAQVIGVITSVLPWNEMEKSSRVMDSVDDFTDKAIAFIENSSKTINLSLHTFPIILHIHQCRFDKWWDKFKNKKIKMRNRDPRRRTLIISGALAMCENIDWNIGEFLKINDLKM